MKVANHQGSSNSSILTTTDIIQEETSSASANSHKDVHSVKVQPMPVKRRIVTQWNKPLNHHPLTPAQKNNKLDKLPDKVLTKIYAYLNPSELCSLLMCSMKFYQSISSHVFRSIRLSSIKTLAKILASLSSRKGSRKVLGSVKKFSLSRLAERSDPAYTNYLNASMMQLSRGCPNITHLDFSHFHYLSDSSIQVIAKELSRTLKSINLQYCLSVTSVSVLALAQHCTQLESVDLAYGPRILNTALERLADKLGDKLIYINISGCELIDANGIKYLLDGCTALKIIELCHLNHIWKRSVNDADVCTKCVEACERRGVRVVRNEFNI
ncbi:hypothetical protein BKA69DRAFT_1085967 [Paraphysoderma sedebokerense]|nr:hypothetical protein BKA69DRAFT_1085967 [Paraphysoderma sedebokerense]